MTIYLHFLDLGLKPVLFLVRFIALFGNGGLKLLKVQAPLVRVRTRFIAPGEQVPTSRPAGGVMHHKVRMNPTAHPSSAAQAGQAAQPDFCWRVACPLPQLLDHRHHLVDLLLRL